MSNAGERAFQLINTLDYERIAGSLKELKAAYTIMSTLDSMGIQYQTQPFDIPLYRINKAQLSIVSSTAEDAFYEVTGYGYSGNTPTDGLEAPFIYIENGEDTFLAQAVGCIALVNNHPTPALYHKMIKAGIVGFISISGTICDSRDDTDLDRRSLRANRHLAKNVPTIPGLCMRAIDAAKLLDAAPERCNILLQQEVYTGQSNNIIVDIPGTDTPQEYLLFSAHYDSVPFSHGAYDNASGSAIIMELCRFISAHPLRRSCRFIWCGAEEIGLEGSKYYAQCLTQDEIGQMRLCINIDLAGQLIGANHAIASAENSLCNILQFVADSTGCGVNIRQDIFPSDASSFADIGIPAVSLYRTGAGGHSRRDTACLMHPLALQKTYNLALELAKHTGNSTVFPLPHTIPENIRQKLNEYFVRT